MATFTERIAVIIDAKTGDGVSKLKKFGDAAEKAGSKAVSSGKESAGLAAAFEKVGLGAFSANAGALAASAGLGVLAAAAVKVGGASIGAFTDLAGQVLTFKRAMGGTAEEAAQIAAQVRAFGVDADAAAKGLFKFSRTLGDNPDALREFGVQAVKAKDGSVDVGKTLLAVQERFRATTSGAQRNALAFAAFGRAAQGLAPLLGASARQIEAINTLARDRGQILTQEDLDRARQYKAGLRQIGEELSSFKQRIGKKILPDPTEFAAGLRVVGALLSGSGFNDALKSGANVYVAAAKTKAEQAARDLEEQEKKTASAVKDATSAYFAQRDAARDLSVANIAVAEAEDKLAAARRALKDFQATEDRTAAQNRLELASATTAAARAANAKADADRELNDLLAQGARAGEAAADAQRTLASASQDAVEARQRLADAERALTETIEDGARRQQDAVLSAAEATLSVQQAELRIRDARKNVREAKGGDDRRRAALEVEQAELALQRAQQRRLDAQNDLTGAAGEQARAERDARNAVSDARDAVAGADGAVRTAQQGLVDAARVQDEYNRKLRDAKLAAEEAAQGVESAGLRVQTVSAANAEFEATSASRRRSAADLVVKAQNDVAGATDGVLQKTIAAKDAADGLREKLVELSKDPKALTAFFERLDTKAGDAAASIKDLNDEMVRLHDQLLVSAGRAQANKDANALAQMGPKDPNLVAGTYVPMGGAATAGGVRFGGARAGGGPTRAGETYLVGERGPEWWTAGVDGFVTPNTVGAVGGQPVVVHVHSTTELDGQVLTRSVTKHVSRSRGTNALGGRRITT